MLVYSLQQEFPAATYYYYLDEELLELLLGWVWLWFFCSLPVASIPIKLNALVADLQSDMLMLAEALTAISKASAMMRPVSEGVIRLS